jgi:hypothetical protein
MSLVIKPKYQIFVDASKIRITDITGQYNAASNTGGWGAPNDELNAAALVFAVQRILDGQGSLMTPVDNYIVFDPEAENSKQTSIDFNFSMDGHIKIAIFKLPVSLDGTVDLDSNPLNEGDYFYWNNGPLLWKIQDNVPVEAEVSELIDNVSVVQGTCEDIVFPKLAFKHNSRYTEYMTKRASCDGANDIFNELLQLKLDLAGAKYRFRSGAISEAEDIIESLLKKYDLIL